MYHGGERVGHGVKFAASLVSPRRVPDPNRRQRKIAQIPSGFPSLETVGYPALPSLGIWRTLLATVCHLIILHHTPFVFSPAPPCFEILRNIPYLSNPSHLVEFDEVRQWFRSSLRHNQISAHFVCRACILVLRTD